MNLFYSFHPFSPFSLPLTYCGALRQMQTEIIPNNPVSRLLLQCSQFPGEHGVSKFFIVPHQGAPKLTNLKGFILIASHYLWRKSLVCKHTELSASHMTQATLPGQNSNFPSEEATEDDLPHDASLVGRIGLLLGISHHAIHRLDAG